MWSSTWEVRKLCLSGEFYMSTWSRKLSWLFKEKIQLRQDHVRLKPISRSETGNKEIQILPFMKPIENSNLKGWSCIRRINDQIKLKEKRLCGELEMRNWLFQGSRARICQAIEKLRRICCEVTDRARHLRVDEVSLQQKRNPTSVSQLLTQIQDLQNKANSLADVSDFLRSTDSGAALERPTFPFNLGLFPSPRGMPCRDSGLPLDTRNTAGTSGNVFWKPACSRRTTRSSLRKFQESGIIFLRNATEYYRRYCETGKRNETRAAGFVDACTVLPKRSWSFEPYWRNLLSQWFDGLPEISHLGNASGKIPGRYGIS